VSSSFAKPWYLNVRRWGQTNITEIDPIQYDLDFWRNQWRRTRVQRIIVNAGGIVAYYPSRFELHHRARYLGEHDLFGEVLAAAREEGLAVLARMDSSRADGRFYEMHPDWFCVDRKGKPYRAGDHYIACINGPYYREYLPEVLREIIERYRPDGFADNSWSGLRRESICYCEHCRELFRNETNMPLPTKANWDNETYLRWICWSYTRRIEIWELNSRVVAEAGGEDCLWVGMLNANPAKSCLAFRDMLELARRARLILCDHQSRDELNGFEQNALNGKLLHGIAGWDTLIPESMAMYCRGPRAFRVAASSPAEAHTWMVEGLAGGISPWWHHIGARHNDRRQYHIAEPIMQWHEAYEEYLYDRRPIASIGLVWSQRNIDFYGRDDARRRFELPWRGFTAAMTRARIGYLPVHADLIDEYADQLELLILPDMGVLTDNQCEAIRRFADRGGSIIATGQTSLYDEWGRARSEFALADVLGVRATQRRHGLKGEETNECAGYEEHTYIRLVPEFGAAGRTNRQRHAILEGFEETDILPFGGSLLEVRPMAETEVLATFIPPFPTHPPEFAWIPELHTNIAAIVSRSLPAGGRVVYFAADVDRCYGRRRLPDHGDLIANAVRWALGGKPP